MALFPSRHRLLPATLALLLAGCATLATPSVTWQRANTSADQSAADLRACSAAAQAQAGREQANQGMAGQQPTDVGASIDAYNQDKRVDELTRQCMLLRGYHAVTAGTN